jgi:hypothetical protein
VSSEQDLLRQLQAVLAAAEVDVTELVEGAWAEAQDEVRLTLRRLMSRDLLARSLATLEGGEPPAPSTVTRADLAAEAAPGETASAPAGTPPPAVAQRAADEPAAAPAPPADHAPAREQLTYLFGVVGPDAALPRADLPHLPGGGPLRLLDVGPAQALVCDVDPATFEVLRRPGPDGLDVLAAAAQTHDIVLARFVDAPVLPLALGTVLPNDDTVVDLLRRHAERLARELARIDGMSEWAVTVRTLEDEPSGPAPAPTTSGRDYLEARRAALGRRERRWADQEQLVAALHEPLAACAVDAVEVASRPLEDTAPPLLHGVYLLTDDARDRFRSTVDYLRGEHPDAVIEVTGPWPPYHFTAVDLASEDDPT